MKHYRIIRKWACKNNDLTDSDLELLIYLDCIDLFTIKDFKTGTYTYSWNYLFLVIVNVKFVIIIVITIKTISWILDEQISLEPKTLFFIHIIYTYLRSNETNIISVFLFLQDADIYMHNIKVK